MQQETEEEWEIPDFLSSNKKEIENPKENIFHGIGNLFEALPSFALALVILFIFGVMGFAIIKWAFTIVFGS